MSKIVVLGGGPIGLCTAMLLTRQGHEVMVFERDSAPVPGSPEEACDAWDRRNVAQFRLAHYLHPPAGQLLGSHLPEVRQALLDEGCLKFNAVGAMPPSIADRAPRDGDERFATVTGRRPVLEYAMARVADETLPVRRGVVVAGLVTGPSTGNGIPHVAGVRLADGKEIPADLVVDAMGRNSSLPKWLETIGARQPLEEAEDSGFIYYGRFFRSLSGNMPSCRGPLQIYFPTFSILTLPGDADTWSVTVVFSAGDAALKRLRDTQRWTALITACPSVAHWLDGEPVTDVLAMGGFLDRYRRFVVDGTPVATGIVSVGDSWACTNPSLGRGITMGLMHAVGAAEIVREHLGDPLALALAQDSMTESCVSPWYRDGVEIDRARIRQVNASLEGRTETPPSDPASNVARAFAVAMAHDADVFRAGVEMRSMLALPREVMARPGMVERIFEVANGREPMRAPGPSREEVLRMLA
jgi:2-polyprenyl-6-methoxyphenol hydroxylase-like FAD-dependent oxidoreductase